MKVSGDGDAGDCSETTAGTPKLFVISRRRFLKATGATAALSPFVARAAVERDVVTTPSRSVQPATSTPPKRRPSTNEVFLGIRRERAWIPMKDGVHHKLRRDLFFNGKRIRERSWDESIPRDCH